MDSGDEGEMWLLWIFGEISRQIFHTETKQDSAHQINWDFFCEMRAADELRMVDSRVPTFFLTPISSKSFTNID